MQHRFSNDEKMRIEGRESLKKEREKTKFNVKLMRNLLDGGEHLTQLKDDVMKQMEANPIFQNHDAHDLNVDQERERTMKNISCFVNLFGDKLTNDSEEIRESTLEILKLFDPSAATRRAVHYVLFGGSVAGQGTPEQVSKWFPLISKFKIFGCFGMTELGHGSYVRGVETRATYDVKTQEFIINSPTLTSIKFWIGGAAHTATHCLVVAQLELNGKECGVCNFIVPIRNPENGRLVKGVEIRDIGAKMGRNGADNGWICFSNVRIPRENMLAKFGSVSADGVFQKSGVEQLAFGALLRGRTEKTQESAMFLKHALMISIRYCAVRRQGISPLNPKMEQKLLDYKTTQLRLMSALASCFTIHFAGDSLMQMYKRMNSELEHKDVSSLPTVHASSAVLKAYSTWIAFNAIEVCRQCCGGQGYSSYSALPGLVNNFAVMCTWEGDNTVLVLQASRYLISLAKSEISEKGRRKLIGDVSYISNLSEKRIISNQMNWLSIDFALTAIIEMTRRHLFALVQDLHPKSNTVNENQLWNDHTVRLLHVSKSHAIIFMVTSFHNAISQVKDYDLRDILTKLCLLFALNSIHDDFGHFCSVSVLNGSEMVSLQSSISNLCSEIRQQAVGIVDSFGISDFILNSTIGRSDGDVYNAIFSKTTNNSHPKYRTVEGESPYFGSWIKPTLQSKL